MKSTCYLSTSLAHSRHSYYHHLDLEQPSDAACGMGHKGVISNRHKSKEVDLKNVSCLPPYCFCPQIPITGIKSLGQNSDREGELRLIRVWVNWGAAGTDR